MKSSLIYFLTLFAFFFVSNSTINSQSDPYTVRVNVEGYKHVFEGAGASFPKWLGAHNRMSAADQEKVMQWAGRDLNMQYLQDYVGSYPADDSEFFDAKALYVRNMRRYQSDLKMCVVVNNLPSRLTTTIKVNGNDVIALDHTRRGIYNQVADWYFKVLEAYYLRNVPVSVLNIVNEPDHNKNGVKRYLYGHGGNPQKGVAFLLKEAIPRLRAMINNPSVNTNNIPMPKIMAVSALSARRTPEWVDYLRNNYPAAWREVDILSTHQYARGSENVYFDQMRNRLGGREFIQSEMHAGRGDGLEFLEPILGIGHYTAISAANLVICGVNGGLNSWWYFFVGASGPPDKKSSLISMPFNGGAPQRSHQYYSFRQVTSLQPANSHVMERRIDGREEDDEVIVYRKRGDDHAYVTMVNYNSNSAPAEIIIQNNEGETLNIKSIELYTTNASLNAEVVDRRNYSNPRNRYTFNMSPYSVNTVKVQFEDNTTSECSIVPYARVNDQNWNRTASVTVNANSKVEFGPQSDNFGPRGGTWSWRGPNNFRSSNRGISFSNINPNQAGTYTVTNTDQNNCTASRRFTINVNSSIINNAVYELQPQSDLDLRLDVRGASNQNGTLVMAWSRHGNANQQWKFYNVRENIYEIEPQNATGKRLGVKGLNNTSQNASIDIYDDKNQQNQRWRAIPARNGWFEFESMSTPGMRLDLGGTNRGANAVNRNDDNNRNSQRFKLLPVDANRKGIAVTSNFKIFPNPVDEKLFIQVQGLEDAITVNVVDVSGRQLFENIINGDQLSDGTISLSTTSWSPGIYFVTIKNGDQKITDKILKK